jgi:hypothetical protein
MPKYVLKIYHNDNKIWTLEEYQAEKDKVRDNCKEYHIENRKKVLPVMNFSQLEREIEKTRKHYNNWKEL